MPHREHSQLELEAFLEARLSATGDWADPASFYNDLARTFPEEPVPLELERRHLSRMMRAWREGAGPAAAEATPAAGEAAEEPLVPFRRRGLEPATSAAVPSAGSRPVAGGSAPGRSAPAQGWRSRLGLRQSVGIQRASALLKAAVAVLAVSTVFTGAAAAGGLPDPIQSAVADVAARAGLQIPHPLPAPPARPGTPEQATVDGDDVASGEVHSLGGSLESGNAALRQDSGAGGRAAAGPSKDRLAHGRDKSTRSFGAERAAAQRREAKSKREQGPSPEAKSAAGGPTEQAKAPAPGQTKGAPDRVGEKQGSVDSKAKAAAKPGKKPSKRAAGAKPPASGKSRSAKH